MTNQNENNNENEVIKVGIRLESDVYAAVEQVRIDEDRPSTANAVERLLKTHPKIKIRLREAETAGVGA